MFNNIIYDSIQDSIIKKLKRRIIVLEQQLNDYILSVKTFKEISYVGVKNGVNTVFTLPEAIGDELVVLNGQVLVKNLNYSVSIDKTIITMIDLDYIPLSTDYLVIRGYY